MEYLLNRMIESTLTNHLSKGDNHLTLPKYTIRGAYEGLPELGQKPTIPVTNYFCGMPNLQTMWS